MNERVNTEKIYHIGCQTPEGINDVADAIGGRVERNYAYTTISSLEHPGSRVIYGIGHPLVQGLTPELRLVFSNREGPPLALRSRGKPDQDISDFVYIYPNDEEDSASRKSVIFVSGQRIGNMDRVFNVETIQIRSGDSEMVRRKGSGVYVPHDTSLLGRAVLVAAMLRECRTPEERKALERTLI